MALKHPFMVKNFTGVTTAELKADVGKSLLVKDIFVKSVADGYVTLKIDRLTVGYFRVDNDKLGNLLHYPLAQSQKRTILGLLNERGLFAGYPIAEGQTLELSGLGAGAMTATLVYEEYDAGDINPAMQNGTEADEYLYIAFGDTGAPITAAGEFLYSKPRIPSEFPAFPFGADVPPRTTIEILGMLASERGADDGTLKTNYIHTKFYKLMRGREVLFDTDRQGIYAKGSDVATNAAFECQNGQSILGEYSDLAQRPPLFFPEPLVFQAGDELNVYVTTEVAATPGRFELDEQEIGLILRVKVAK